MRYYNYEKLAKEVGMTMAQLRELKRQMRAEFPHDQMMFELHVMRAVMAVRDGRITLEQALRSEPSRA